MSPLLQQVLELIRARREEFETRFGIRLLGVVGSVARGEEREDSDVDILADVTGRPTLFTIAEAEYTLGDLIGRKVDLVFREELRPAALAHMTRDFAQA